jgi:hypothetical protein
MMQARDVDKALVGFTKAVQFDPENGEAWNNIACLYVIFTLVILLFVHPKLTLSLSLSLSLSLNASKSPTNKDTNYQ